jgi:molybdate transport repressor ModE-like protein
MTHKVSIQPQWTIQRPGAPALSPRLLALLVLVHEHGSLAVACQRAGTSYRHAWDLVHQGEAVFGAPLLTMARGRGSKLTPLGEKLVWADHRVAARLKPVLDTLASELEAEIEKLVGAEPAPMRVRASHGFAIEKLIEFLERAGVPVERKYIGAQEAVAALHDGACDVAGFPLPVGEFEPRAMAHYARWLDVKLHRLIDVATRRQGLMLERGNPRGITGVQDLVRPDVRFINRQRGSGTRFLLECLLEREGVDPDAINGYEQGEYTHAAVAAYVASGMADAGFGVETPARHFKLDFIPMASERYFLLCAASSLDTPHLRETLAMLRSDEFRRAVNELPGYDATQAGVVQTIAQAANAAAPERSPRAARGPLAR